MGRMGFGQVAVERSSRKVCQSLLGGFHGKGKAERAHSSRVNSKLENRWFLDAWYLDPGYFRAEKVLVGVGV
jgi:hypothetical protein